MKPKTHFVGHTHEPNSLRPLWQVSGTQPNNNGHGRCWAKPTLAKPTLPIFRPILANRGLDRLWPNQLWPILVFYSFDRLWPNRLWPILVF